MAEVKRKTLTQRTLIIYFRRQNISNEKMRLFGKAHSMLICKWYYRCCVFLE